MQIHFRDQASGLGANQKRLAAEACESSRAASAASSRVRAPDETARVGAQGRSRHAKHSFRRSATAKAGPRICSAHRWRDRLQPIRRSPNARGRGLAGTTSRCRGGSEASRRRQRGALVSCSLGKSCTTNSALPRLMTGPTTGKTGKALLKGHRGLGKEGRRLPVLHGIEA